MEYLTIILQPRLWLVYGGVGVQDNLLGRREVTSSVVDMCAAQPPVLWICGRKEEEGYFVERLNLPGLTSEPVTWNQGRIGAITAASNGRGAVVLSLPENRSAEPRLWLWSGTTWTAIETAIVPDISSKLAWIADERLVYESVNRSLVVLDLASGRVESGPSGFYPVAASDIREWYAIHEEQVVRFPVAQPFEQLPMPVEGFSFGAVGALRVTRDGRIFSWAEPRFGLRSKGYLQERNGRRLRFRFIDNGAALGAVVGPYAL
jgi:hypothetical protein